MTETAFRMPRLRVARRCPMSDLSRTPWFTTHPVSDLGRTPNLLLPRRIRRRLFEETRCPI